jgi:pyruvate dehydrogenase E1 component
LAQFYPIQPPKGSERKDFPRLQAYAVPMTTLAPVRELRGHRLRLLRELERKVLWLSAWTVHNANHLRANRDGLKVGGHQASSASLATVMTALYFSVLRPEDRVAV